MPNTEALGPIFHNQVIPQFVNARKAKNISQFKNERKKYCKIEGKKEPYLAKTK